MSRLNIAALINLMSEDLQENHISMICSEVCLEYVEGVTSAQDALYYAISSYSPDESLELLLSISEDYLGNEYKVFLTGYL